MLIIIVVFGALSAIALFIMAIMLFTAGQVWFGLGLLLSILYVVALTVLLIRLDGRGTENRNAIAELERELDALKRALNIPDPELLQEAEVTVGQEQTQPESAECAHESDPEIDMDGIRFCKVCGYQLFPENKVCPMCGAKSDGDDIAM